MNKDKYIQKLERENLRLKLSCAKCYQCKHANYYIPHQSYPFTQPRCDIDKKNIKYDDNACRNFEFA